MTVRLAAIVSEDASCCPHGTEVCASRYGLGGLAGTPRGVLQSGRSMQPARLVECHRVRSVGRGREIPSVHRARPLLIACQVEALPAPSRTLTAVGEKARGRTICAR